MLCFAGLCPDYETWSPKNNVGNATEAMDTAEQWLEVPQVNTRVLFSSCLSRQSIYSLLVNVKGWHTQFVHPLPPSPPLVIK